MNKSFLIKYESINKSIDRLINLSFGQSLDPASLDSPAGGWGKESVGFGEIRLGVEGNDASLRRGPRCDVRLDDVGGVN